MRRVSAPRPSGWPAATPCAARQSFWRQAFLRRPPRSPSLRPRPGPSPSFHPRPAEALSRANRYIDGPRSGLPGVTRGPRVHAPPAQMRPASSRASRRAPPAPRAVPFQRPLVPRPHSQRWPVRSRAPLRALREWPSARSGCACTWPQRGVWPPPWPRRSYAERIRGATPARYASRDPPHDAELLPFEREPSPSRGPRPARPEPPRAQRRGAGGSPVRGNTHCSCGSPSQAKPNGCPRTPRAQTIHDSRYCPPRRRARGTSGPSRARQMMVTLVSASV